MKPDTKNLFVVSLGCDKNRVDTEKMLGLLKDAGYQLVYDEAEADIILINTCCFIGDAKEESIQTILEMAAWKEGRCRFLVVTGCLAERYREEVLTEMPEVDAVIGTSSWTEIVQVLEKLEKENGPAQVFLPHTAIPRQCPAKRRHGRNCCGHCGQPGS